MNNNTKICILGGGWSNERLISLKSANDVQSVLMQNGHDSVLYDMDQDSFVSLEKFLSDNNIDIVFNLIHGEGGEDGKVQSYLDKLNIKYCGSSSRSSKISFNKYLTKKEWELNNLQTASFDIFQGQKYESLVDSFGHEFFIKDTCSGSSNNIFLIRDLNDYKNFLKKKGSREYLIERKIYADEYTAAILNDKVLPIIKIVPSNEFYDFEAKYESNDTKFIFPELDEDITRHINNEVMKAFKVLGCKTWARVDFFVDKGNIILLEINTIPGMTDHSLVPKAAKQYGLSYYQLVLEILGINV